MLTETGLRYSLKLKKSVPQIAKEFNKTVGSVRYLQKKYNLRSFRFTEVCLTCGKPISGRKFKFCSTGCKTKYHGPCANNVVAQYQRGLKRKLHLIKMLGGKCSRCGYNKNITALCFHHIEPSKKNLRLDMRRLSNNSMKVLLAEVSKCSLLCHNCHCELHHPKYDNILI